MRYHTAANRADPRKEFLTFVQDDPSPGAGVQRTLGSPVLTQRVICRENYIAVMELCSQSLAIRAVINEKPQSFGPDMSW